MANSSKRQRRLWDTYTFPGFRPQPTVRGVFGDPKARIITLARRAKKRFAGAAGDTHLLGRLGKTFHFEKPRTRKFRDGWAAWHLKLALVTTAHHWRGSMKIYRFYKDRALLVDTNLLTSDFPVVLADALDRTLSSKEGMVAVLTASTDFTAAEAS